MTSSFETQIISALLSSDALYPKILLLPTESEAQAAEKYLKQLLRSPSYENKKILYIPGFFQTGVYRFESVKNTLSLRLRQAYDFYFNSHACAYIITTPAGLLRSFPKKVWFEKNSFTLNTKTENEIDDLKTKFDEIGYSEGPQVEQVGDYTIRGSLFEFWCPLYQNPIRLEFFGDNLEKIRFFRTSDQRSFESVEKITVIPPREFVWPKSSEMESALEKLNNICLSQKVLGQVRADTLENIKDNIFFPGIDDLNYMFSNDTSESFFHIFSKTVFHHDSSFLIFCGEKESFETSYVEIKKLYEDNYRSAAGKNTLAPKLENVFPQFDSFHHQILSLPQKLQNTYSIPNWFFESEKALSQGQSKTSLLEKTELIKSFFSQSLITHLIILADSQDSFFELSGMLSSYFPEFKNINLTKSLPYFTSDSLNDLKNNKTEKLLSFSTQIFSGQLDSQEGFFIDNDSQKFLVISEKWLRGLKKINRIESYNATLDSAQQRLKIESIFSAQFQDFKENELVVHVNHGIGRFRGLVTIQVNDIKGDFLAIEYAGNDKIYVPVNKLTLIHKYLGVKNDDSVLDNLKANQQWEKKKARAREEAEKIAREILEFQARRELTPGNAFSPITEEFIAFEDAFPFEETPDQLQASREIMQDMSKPKAMDRLLCGDVGFGKTEVAMRAAFRCVLDGKQVAWLVPTTVLAHQHYRSLKERFHDFAVNVELFDRSLTSKATDDALDRTKKGEIDILVGTHKLLSKSLHFKDLGLLIVDEEHRFGVMQKEKIKTLSFGVDVLTMTATPIPRTFQMAMSGLRDLSLLTTPPSSRLATKTFVCPFDEQIIKEAITSEINRGGQIFYVHNRVEKLGVIHDFLKNLLPFDVKIAIGHGKMTQKELEKIVVDFTEGKYHVLLCTTIMESGIDMPNVNTIVVQDADHFGLAQLYQLRGRVGRRSTRGNAYFLMSTDAKKDDPGVARLNILKEHQELGSGFIIAGHDLEMRGGGSLIGDEQSGHVNDVGLETYSQMLNDAMKSLAGMKVKAEKDVEITLPFSFQIPQNYIENTRERLKCYRRFFGARDEAALQNLLQECEDRFGPIPLEVQDLAEVARIRRWLTVIGAVSLVVKDDHTEIKFSPDVLQFDESDSESEAFFKRLIDCCNRHVAGMRLTQDGRLLLNVKKRNFVTELKSTVAITPTLKAGLNELKRTLSLLAGETHAKTSI